MWLLGVVWSFVFCGAARPSLLAGRFAPVRSRASLENAAAWRHSARSVIHGSALRLSNDRTCPVRRAFGAGPRRDYVLGHERQYRRVCARGKYTDSLESRRYWGDRSTGRAVGVRRQQSYLE
jgi:hypothetical protein